MANKALTGLAILALCAFGAANCSFTIPEIEQELSIAVNEALNAKTRAAITEIRKAVERRLDKVRLPGVPITWRIPEQIQIEAALDYLKNKTSTMDENLYSDYYTDRRDGWSRFEKLYQTKIERFCGLVKWELEPTIKRLMKAIDTYEQNLSRPGVELPEELLVEPSEFANEWLDNWIVADALSGGRYIKIDLAYELLKFRSGLAGKTVGLTKGCLRRYVGKEPAKMLDRAVSKMLDIHTV